MVISKEYVLLGVLAVTVVGIVTYGALHSTSNATIKASQAQANIPNPNDMIILKPAGSYVISDMPGPGDTALIPFEIKFANKIPNTLVITVDSKHWGIIDVLIKDNRTGNFVSINPQLDNVKTFEIGGSTYKYSLDASFPVSKVINGDTATFYVELVQYSAYNDNDEFNLIISDGQIQKQVPITVRFKTSAQNGGGAVLG